MTPPVPLIDTSGFATAYPNPPAGSLLNALRNLTSGRANVVILRRQITPADIDRARERTKAAPAPGSLDPKPTPLARFDESTDLNTTFRDMYLAIAATRKSKTLKAENTLMPMASTAIEYYRRMAKRVGVSE